MDKLGCVEREWLDLLAILADNARIVRKRNSGRRLDFVGLRIYAPNAMIAAARVASLRRCAARVVSYGYSWSLVSVRREVLNECIVFSEQQPEAGSS